MALENGEKTMTSFSTINFMHPIKIHLKGYKSKLSIIIKHHVLLFNRNRPSSSRIDFCGRLCDRQQSSLLEKRVYEEILGREIRYSNTFRILRDYCNRLWFISNIYSLALLTLTICPQTRKLILCATSYTYTEVCTYF